METQTGILRLGAVLATTGQSRSPHYEAVAEGLFTRPVKVGKRAVGWPSHEVAAIVRARIRGASESDIRKLVAKLHADRTAEAEVLA